MQLHVCMCIQYYIYIYIYIYFMSIGIYIYIHTFVCINHIRWITLTYIYHICILHMYPIFVSYVLYVISYCILLYCVILYCIIWYHIILFYTLFYHVISHHIHRFIMGFAAQILSAWLRFDCRSNGPHTAASCEAKDLRVRSSWSQRVIAADRSTMQLIQ